MKKLIGLNKVKTAVFISGTGSNLKKLHKFSLLKKSPIKVEMVISNNPKAKGIDFAKKKKIDNKIYTFKNRINDENKILSFLKKNEITLICLAGFMRILSENFINKFKGKILNIHPSLLPKYKGLNTHKRAINNKERYSGCTVHFVTIDRFSSKIGTYRS